MSSCFYGDCNENLSFILIFSRNRFFFYLHDCAKIYPHLPKTALSSIFRPAVHRRVLATRVKYLGAAAMMAVVHQRQPVTLLLAKYIHNGKMTRLFRTTIQIFKSLLLIDKIDKILAVKLLSIMYYLLFVLCRS